MTSGFSTIAGSVLVAYMNLGVPPETLVTSSVMSIPASLAISKIRIPETEEPITRGNVTVDRGYEDANKAPVCKFLIFGDVSLISILGKRSPCFQPRSPFRSDCCWSNSVRYSTYRAHKYL